MKTVGIQVKSLCCGHEEIEMLLNAKELASMQVIWDRNPWPHWYRMPMSWRSDGLLMITEWL